MFRSKAWWLSLSAFFFDLVAVGGAWLAGYFVRFNGAVPHEFLDGAFKAFFWVLPIYALMFRLYDTPVGVATRTQRDAPMPQIATVGCP